MKSIVQLHGLRLFLVSLFLSFLTFSNNQLQLNAERAYSQKQYANYQSILAARSHSSVNSEIKSSICLIDAIALVYEPSAA